MRNTLEGVGAALEVDQPEEMSFNEIKIYGNMVNVYALLMLNDEHLEKRFQLKGDLLQAIGGSINFINSYFESSVHPDLYALYGDLLDTIGNSLQSIGTIQDLKTKKALQ